MVNFFIVDVAFLIVFSLFIGMFLYKHRKNLQKQGIILMYRTQLGVKIIEFLAKKYRRFWLFIAPLVIATGYFLMAAMVFLLGQTLWIYFKIPNVTDYIKAPPIAPLIPYFPRIFGVESFFPNFYFTYFLIALMVVAITHEFAHGIYMKVFKTKIKSTGFLFIGPILGAFVEHDEKDLKKKKIKEQLAILSAGVFSNLVFAGIFFLILLGFFSVAFQPAGFVFNIYSPVSNSDGLVNDLNESHLLGEYDVGNVTIYIDESNGRGMLGNLGVVKEIDGSKVRDFSDLREILEQKSIGDSVNVLISIDGEKKTYRFELGERDGKGVLGVGNLQPAKDWKRKIFDVFTIKKPITDYEELFNGADFIYNLLWWLMVINFFVALFNMLPLGILDGGQFFYLTALSLTKSKKFSKKLSSLVTATIILIFVLLMVIYFVRIF